MSEKLMTLLELGETCLWIVFTYSSEKLSNLSEFGVTDLGIMFTYMFEKLKNLSEFGKTRLVPIFRNIYMCKHDTPKPVTPLFTQIPEVFVYGVGVKGIHDLR